MNDEGECVTGEREPRGSSRKIKRQRDNILSKQGI